MKDSFDATVGIFMPAYNHGKFIDEAIKSLKEQTFQDFKLHIVDDGSNDGKTPQKLKSIKYDKVTLFLNKDNRGVAYRAKEHFKVFKTKYILVLCADDVLAPDFLEKTVSFLEKNKSYGAVGTNVRFFKDDPKDYYYEQKYDSKLMNLGHVLARNQILGSSLMRTKALKDADLSGGFVRYQDWDRWISMMEKGWKIGLIPEYLFYYRQLSSSLSHSASIEDELTFRKLLLKKHNESYKKYYKDIIIDMEYAFLEMKESKDWLDGEYHRLTSDNNKLRDKIKNLEQENMKLSDDLTELRNSRAVKISSKIRRIFGSK